MARKRLKTPSYLDTWRNLSSGDVPRLSASIDIPHPLCWQQIKREDWELVPNVSAVYVLWGQDDSREYYVGETGNLHRRIRPGSHNIEWEWKRVSFLPVRKRERRVIESIVATALPKQLRFRPQLLQVPDDIDSIELLPIETEILRVLHRRRQNFHEIVDLLSLEGPTAYHKAQYRIKKLLRRGFVERASKGHYTISASGSEWVRRHDRRDADESPAPGGDEGQRPGRAEVPERRPLGSQNGTGINRS